jgi:TolB-like protein/DNA-binding winged helix-turn-helix (wHTH) protein/Flp pilus assembly protein TadD
MMILDAGRVVLDVANDRLLLDGRPVRLRGKPLNVLRELMTRHGQLVTKEDLLESVWEGRPHSDAVLTTAVKEVRQALGDNPRSPWAVETVHRRGYRFLLPVSTEARADAPEVPADGVRAGAAAARLESAGARPDAADGRAEASPAGRAAPSIPRWVIPVALVLVLAAVARLLFAPGDEDAVESVAVLPFGDMTSGGDHRWFADGLGEELLNSLARIGGLQVAARTSTERFFGTRTDIREIGAALGVSHVIEGSVRNAADGRMRLTVQLIRARDGFHEWSSTWDRNLSQTSALDIQKDVSDRVAALMQGHPTPPAPLVPAARLPDAAWELLVRGRTLVERRNADGIDAGINLLHEALELAPDHPTTHAALASAYLLAVDAGQRTPNEVLETAEYHAGRALELDPDSVEALVASAFLSIARQDLEAGLAFVDRAIAISPGHARAHQRRGVILTMSGRLEDAYAAFGAARRLDPLAPLVLANYSQSAMNTGRIDEAFEVARDNLRWNPQHHLARSMMGWLSLQAGLYERALVCLRAGLEASPRSQFSAGNLGEVYWRIGADELAASVVDGPTGWSTRAAVSLSNGDDAPAEGGSPQRSGLNGLTPLDVYYWAGDADAAASWAAEFLRFLPDPGALATAGMLPDNSMTALAVLESADDPRAVPLRDALARRFAERGPEDAHTLGDLLSGAAWYAREGDDEASLAWLERAAELGFVMRELDLDPAFQSVRQAPAFRRLRSRMDERAAEVRAVLGSTEQC